MKASARIRSSSPRIWTRSFQPRPCCSFGEGDESCSCPVFPTTGQALWLCCGPYAQPGRRACSSAGRWLRWGMSARRARGISAESGIYLKLLPGRHANANSSPSTALDFGVSLIRLWQAAVFGSAWWDRAAIAGRILGGPIQSTRWQQPSTCSPLVLRAGGRAALSTLE